MEIKTVKVVYDLPINIELDKKIFKAMSEIGGAWYAQGSDLIDGNRDIAFDFEVKDIS